MRVPDSYKKAAEGGDRNLLLQLDVLGLSIKDI